MDDEFKATDSTILSTFGQPVTITYPNKPASIHKGSSGKNKLIIGQFEAIAEEITILTIARDIRIRRGDKVLIDGEQWEVDRKIKDDGYLAKWNIHAN